MRISLIAAISENGALGKNNKLPWRLSDDMKLFKGLTTGHFIAMGRKTFESLGSKPLPNRTNLVISRQLDFEAENCQCCTSLTEAINLAKEEGEEELFIIGGGEIFRLSMYLADTLYISHVHANVEADTFFPQIDMETWELSDKKVFTKDSKNEYSFDFCVYQRRQKT